MASSVKNSTPPPEDGIGERIRKLREGLGLSQTQFHQRTLASDPEGKGVSRTVLIGYESGKFKPGARELRVLCATFDVSPTWLLLGAAKDTNPSAKQDEFDDARALLFAGLSEPDLGFVMRLALALTSLKTHEHDALATLIHGIASSRRGAPTMDALTDLATWMAHDAFERLKSLGGSDEALLTLKTAKGAKAIQALTELYRAAHAARAAGRLAKK